MATISDVGKFVIYSSKLAVALYFDTMRRVVLHKGLWALALVGICTVILASIPRGESIWGTIIYTAILVLVIALVLFALFLMLLFSERSPIAVCLPADSEVTTPSGRAEVGELAPGSLVWSWDMRGGRRVARSVTSVRVHRPRPILRIELGSRPAFFATASHSVLCEGGWRRCGKLRAGDRLIIVSDSGTRSAAEITSINAERERKAVCSIRTSQDFNVVCNGVVTHNFTYLRNARCLLYRTIERASAAEVVRDTQLTGLRSRCE